MLLWRAGRRCRWSRTPCSATGRGEVICLVCSVPLFSRAEKNNRCCTNHPDLPTCKTEANDLGLRRRNQDSLHMLYASQAVPKPKYKQARLKTSTRSLIERGVEPLRNLNKGFTVRTTRGLPFNA